MLIVWSILFSSALFSSAFAGDFPGLAISVLDGDTIEVLHDQHPERIRLHGIDCPEKSQAFGNKAKQATSVLVIGKEITLQPHGKDKYGRTIADVLLPDGENINWKLVKEGWCWWYRKYAPHDTELERLEREARIAKKGVWADANPLPPWVYRHPESAAQEDLEAGTVANGLKGMPAAPPQAAGGLIIGNKNSHVYHRPDCPNYTATAPRNRRVFNSKEEAEKAGYELAGNCP